MVLFILKIIGMALCAALVVTVCDSVLSSWYMGKGPKD